MWWFGLVIACSQTPVIEAVSPGEISEGETLIVDGRRFREGTSARLESPEGEEIPLGVRIESRTRLHATLPQRVRPGVWGLVIERGGELVAASAGVQVVPPLEEIACLDEYTANTELSLARSQVVIDRYYRAGDKETVRLPLESITRVELERTESPEGACSAVFLRTSDGRRIVFHDDRAVDLHDRAYRIAQAMGKELVVSVPSDAAAMGDDAGE